MQRESQIRSQAIIQELETIISIARRANDAAELRIRSMTKDLLISSFEREERRKSGGIDEHAIHIAFHISRLILSTNRIAKNLSNNAIKEMHYKQTYVDNLRKQVELAIKRIDSVGIDELYCIMEMLANYNLQSVLDSILKPTLKGKLTCVDDHSVRRRN